MANTYRSVFARPGAARLFASSLIGRLPLGMSSLTMLLLVRESTHSYAAAGAAVGASALAAALCGPVLGRLIDLAGRRLVVGPVAGLQACAYLALALAAGARMGAPVLIGCCALAGALVPPVAPVVRALLRELYDEPRVRETAFSLEAILQETIWIAGPLLTTVVVTVSSPRIAAAMLGAIGLGGTLLFLASPLLATGAPRHGPAGRVSALASQRLRWLLVPVALMGAGLGAVEVGIPSLALHDGSRAASGSLLALWSLGSMAGGVGYSSARWRSGLGSRYAVLLLLNCLSLIPLLLTGSLALAVPASFIAGLAIAPTFSCLYSLVGHVVIPNSEHEAFSWVLSALVIGIAAGSAGAGVLISSLGIHGPFLLALIAAACAAAGSVRFAGMPFGVSVTPT